MRTPRLILACLLGLFAVTAQAAEQKGSAYDYSFTKLLGGDPLPLSEFKGKVLLVVNTASECGFTPQYEGLEKLYETYKDKGLVILGVPSNDFGGQEPGDAPTIAKFCKLNYGVTFPMAGKEVVSGERAHPFYRWAAATLGHAPKWNFHKYVIDRQGHLVDYFASTTGPGSTALKLTIEEQLAK